MASLNYIAATVCGQQCERAGVVKAASAESLALTSGWAAGRHPRQDLRANQKEKIQRRNDVRNIAIIAHVDHGRFTLADSVLFQAKLCGAHLGASGLRRPSSFFLEADSTLCRLLTDSSQQLVSRIGRQSNWRVYAAKPGFGPRPKKKAKKAERVQQVKEDNDPIERARQILSRKQEENKDKAEKKEAEEAPRLIIAQEKPSKVLDEDEFERRLAEIKRLAEVQKKVDEQKKYGPIDYDAPLPSSDKGWANNPLAKIGVGVAVVVFGLVFALGDILPSGRPTVEKSDLVQKLQLKPDEIAKLQAQVKDLEETIRNSPDDRIALEGAGVIYAELGDFNKAAEYLSKIVQKSPGNVEALRLLAEVQNANGDYDASIGAYRAAIRASKKESMTLVQGLTDSLLAAKKPSEAVGELLAARARLKSSVQQKVLAQSTSGESMVQAVEGDADVDSENYGQIDPVQVELLLGKAYAAWGHSGDAVNVYDGLISNYPDDYRGYLAKGVLLKDQGKGPDAERMFIQARYLAPSDAKLTVDKYSGRQPS